MTIEIHVPVCHCVAAARRLSAVFPIPSKYRTEGGAAGADTVSALGYLVVSCDYCGTPLRSAEGIDLAKPVALREAGR